MSGLSDHRGAERPTARGSFVTVLLGALLTGVVVLVATLAAATGPTDVFSGAGPNPDRIGVVATPTPSPVEAADDDSDVDAALERGTPRDLTWLGPLVRGFLLVLVVVALALTAVHVLRRRRPRRGRSGLEVDDDADFDLAGPIDAVAAALVADAERQDAALRGGSPRNGIVEAWLRFEQQAARAGVPRADWETSTEFTVRLLDTAQVDPEATARLADLFRLARFSDHPITEAEREDAAEVLQRIRVRLAATSRGRAES